MKTLFVAFVLGCFLFPAGMQAQESDFVLLDSTLAKDLVGQCSRWAPQIEGSWNPSQAEIAGLEHHLGEIASLRTDSCCMIGTQILEPAKYLRQYVGVIVGGKKLIYVNAFPREALTDWPKGRAPNWRTDPWMVCDGGEAFWGVLYDPSRQEFFALATNGVG